MATVIEIGDLVFLDVDQAKPAAALPDAESEAGNQATFHAKFAGVAMQRSRSGDSEPIRVATTGVFEFACASAYFEIGALIGPKPNDDADGLENQTVKDVGNQISRAIGRVAKRVNPADVRVLVQIVSSVMYGGPQAIAS
jgi:hypothetical protein